MRLNKGEGGMPPLPFPELVEGPSLRGLLTEGTQKQPFDKLRERSNLPPAGIIAFCNHVGLGCVIFALQLVDIVPNWRDGLDRADALA